MRHSTTSSYLTTEAGDVLIAENGADALIASALTGSTRTTEIAIPADTIAIAGMRPGDRYLVCHAQDQTPEKYGRQALGVGIWQGGDVHVPIANAYPDTTGPFYLMEQGRTGCFPSAEYANPLASDAKRRKES